MGGYCDGSDADTSGGNDIIGAGASVAALSAVDAGYRAAGACGGNDVFVVIDEGALAVPAHTQTHL